MKEVKALIKPLVISKVVAELESAGYDSLTLSKGQGTGKYETADVMYNLEILSNSNPIIKQELVCQNEEAKM
jgi:nitrogen regulatory protein P-II 1